MGIDQIPENENSFRTNSQLLTGWRINENMVRLILKIMVRRNLIYWQNRTI